jgi:signal transduction histidine kinase
MMRRSLSATLLLTATVALFASIALIFGAWTAVVRYQPAFLSQRGLANLSGTVVAGLRFDVSGKPISVELNPNLQYIFDALPLDVLYRVLDNEGNVLLSSGASRDALGPEGMSLAASQRTLAQVRNGIALHILTVPVDRAGSRSYVQVARSERFDSARQENDSSTERKTALVAAVVAMVVFGAVVLYTVHHMLQRVKRVSDAAARIGPHNLTARLDITGVPAEIAPLMESFNSVLERLELGYRVQQQFLAAAAHELKTPIALMRGQIELAGSAGGAALLKDLDHMSRQVHQLLHLAEVSEVQSYSGELLDVTQIVADAVTHLARLTEARDVSVRLERPIRKVKIPADRGALFVLVRNLVENAVHHSPPSAFVSVRVDAEGIYVRDHGRGIAEADLPMLFQRFWRGAHRRDEGAGLGLSICREIARAHDWTLTAKNAQRGAEFTLLFKPAQSEPRRSPGPLPGVARFIRRRPVLEHIKASLRRMAIRLASPLRKVAGADNRSKGAGDPR